MRSGVWIRVVLVRGLACQPPGFRRVRRGFLVRDGLGQHVPQRPPLFLQAHEGALQACVCIRVCIRVRDTVGIRAGTHGWGAGLWCGIPEFPIQCIVCTIKTYVSLILNENGTVAPYLFASSRATRATLPVHSTRTTSRACPCSPVEWAGTHRHGARTPRLRVGCATLP